ncbi:MAG: aminotransferase class V-fold PLP-dependent enzyme [Candidatus Poribacteria bacterium]
MSNCLITDELIKEEFPASSKNSWLCTGIVGVMPKSAAKALADIIMRFETEFFFHHSEVDSAVETLRGRLANLISAKNPTDICFTRNPTEGIIIGLSNIDLNSGDEIVTSNQEHGALLDRLNFINNRGRAKLRMFEIHGDPEETLQSMKSQINEKTKILAFSHVSCQSGIRLPVVEMCKLAREVGAYVLLDGAQTIGNIPVNVTDYDCDFYVGNGHKWLCGPLGTSFLYVNPDSEISLSSTFMAFGSAGDDSATKRNALRFEYGTRDKMLLYGLLKVFELYDKWGWQMKEGRIKELTAYLREKMSAIPKCSMITPMDWEKSSGNTSFTMEGYTWDKVNSYLSSEWKIYLRAVPEISVNRVSTSYFNTYKEVYRLIEALKAM